MDERQRDHAHVGEPIDERVRPTSILVAEDDPTLRELLAMILREEGHTVMTVASADAMKLELDRCGAHRTFDVLVTDIRMPGTSGLDVVANLRAAGSTIPIIVMTAFPDDGVQERAVSLGALLVAKPFSLATICLAVDGLLASHREEHAS